MNKKSVLALSSKDFCYSSTSNHFFLNDSGGIQQVTRYDCCWKAVKL